MSLKFKFLESSSFKTGLGAALLLAVVSFAMPLTADAKPLPEVTPKLETEPPKANPPIHPRRSFRLRNKTKTEVTTVRITHTMTVPTAPDPAANSDLQQELRQKIYEKIKSECAILEAAFERTCKIKNINMSNNNYSRNRSTNRISGIVTYELAPPKKDTDKPEGERDL